MIHPESKGTGRAALVRDYAVRMSSPGVPAFEPVFAGLEPVPGAIAHGVIIEFEDETWEQLVRFEKSYVLEEVRAEVLPGPKLEADAQPVVEVCLAFCLHPQRRGRPEGRPSARYARKLVEGARTHGLPEAVIARYERAAEQGSRLSLSLLWLYPVAQRIGLVPTAVLLGVAALGLLAGLVLGAFALCQRVMLP